jgi:hypothetical protein
MRRAKAELEGQTGFGDAADTNQGDNSLSGREQRSQLVQLAFPATKVVNEAGKSSARLYARGLSATKSAFRLPRGLVTDYA